MWSETKLTQRLGLALPIFQAPMAGAVGPELAIAVCEAGGLGALSVAMASPARIREEAALVRASTKLPFNLNLFAFEPGTASAAQLERIHARLAPIRAELGIPTPSTLPKIEDGEAQLEAALDVKPAVFSFTFGIPRREHLDAFRKLGTILVGTATHLAEARALEDAGVDAISVQGSEAGGHRGTFIGRAEDALTPTLELVAQIRAVVELPLIAAGGLMDGRDIARALRSGADAAQLGTAFMACPEAKLLPLHLRALLSPAARNTRVTRALTGRAARGIVNRLMEHLDAHPDELLPYPLQGAAIRDIRAAATTKDDPELQQLWAGTGAPRIRQLPAAELMSVLAREAEVASLNGA